MRLNNPISNNMLNTLLNQAKGSTFNLDWVTIEVIKLSKKLHVNIKTFKSSEV